MLEAEILTRAKHIVTTKTGLKKKRAYSKNRTNDRNKANEKKQKFLIESSWLVEKEYEIFRLRNRTNKGFNVRDNRKLNDQGKGHEKHRERSSVSGYGGRFNSRTTVAP